jgi:hypothetical protein
VSASSYPFPLVDVEGDARSGMNSAGIGLCVQEALRDHFGLPDSVCRHRAPRPDGTEIETVASVVMDLAEGALWLCPGPVCENDYRRFALRAR